MVIKALPRSDFYFTVTSWELASLCHLNQVVEENLANLLQNYGISDAEALTPGARAKAELDLMFVEARIPSLHRVPVLTMAWALYESCAVEVSRFFEQKLGLKYSVATPDKQMPESLSDRWRRWSIVRRAHHFFQTELGFPPAPAADDERRLEELRLLRNVLVHGGGRRSPSKPRDWEQLARIASRRAGLDLNSGYVLPSAEFVRGEIDLVRRVTGHIVHFSREIVRERRLHD